MAQRYRIISADSHIIEPPDLWERWLEPKYRDKAPKLAKDEEGGDAWVYEDGGRPEPLGLSTTVGTMPEQLKWTGARYGHEIHPGCHNGKERLELLDIDGVDAEVLYPPPRAMDCFMRYDNADLQLAGIHAYNDWLIDEFCAADSSRLVGLAQIPNLGVEASVAELHRAKEKGYRGVVLAMWPSGNDNLSLEDDSFWAAAEETEMPVSIHIYLASQVTVRRPVQALGAASGVTAFTYTPPLIVEMIFSGVFDRFPNLQIVAAEIGVGWIPHFLEMMDDRYWRNRHWAKTDLKKPPSQYWKDNWLGAFIVDRIGVQLRHAVGVENMAWFTDFPHHGNSWPYSRKLIDEHFVNVSEVEREKIICTNIGKRYGLID